jgi:hypothetical protein
MKSNQILPSKLNADLANFSSDLHAVHAKPSSLAALRRMKKSLGDPNSHVRSLPNASFPNDEFSQLAAEIDSG